jgi:hypothetical protein
LLNGNAVKFGLLINGLEFIVLGKKKEKKSKWFKMEVVVSIASIIIAVAALLLTYVQIEQTNKHNRLSVSPNLSFNTLWDVNSCEDLKMHFELSSNGLGPAIVEDIEFCIRDTCFNGAIGLRNYISRIAHSENENPAEFYTSSASNVGLGMPLRSGYKIRFLEMDDFTSYEIFKEIQVVLEDFILRVNYKDIYGTEFEINTELNGKLVFEAISPMVCK